MDTMDQIYWGVVEKPSENLLIWKILIMLVSEGFSTTPQYIWSMVSIYSNLLIYFLKVTSK